MPTVQLISPRVPPADAKVGFKHWISTCFILFSGCPRRTSLTNYFIDRPTAAWCTGRPFHGVATTVVRADMRSPRVLMIMPRVLMIMVVFVVQCN